MIIEKTSFAKVYDEIIFRLIEDPEYITAPRGLKIKEYLNVQLVVRNPRSNLFKCGARSVPLNYLTNELLLYFTARNETKYFERASKFWKTIENSNGTVNSAYGDLIFNYQLRDNNNYRSQWDWARESLIKDKDSRQAIMHYNRPWHQINGIKDFPCTISNQFFIRNEKLHLTTYMRSNDVFFGLTYDFPFFTILMEVMVSGLKEFYPKLELGTYTHFAGSLHAYEKDFEVLDNMNKCCILDDGTPSIKENPIYHPAFDKMIKDPDSIYTGDDEFIKWIDTNRK